MQATQGMHALHEFIEEYTAKYKIWLKNPYIGFLSTQDELSLSKLKEKLQLKGLSVSSFREPDLDNQLTAIAVEPNLLSVRCLSSLPLALKEYKHPT